MQPGELAKLSVVLYLASFLVRKEQDMARFFQGMVPPVLVVGMLAGLVLLEPDMGTAVVMTMLLLGLLFVGGARLSYLVGLVGILSGLAYMLIMESDYRRRRLLNFLDPWQDPTDAGFQLTQSFVALGNGGLFGVGLGAGRQKLFFLPEAHSDFVLALVGEELGFAGTGAADGSVCRADRQRVSYCGPGARCLWTTFGVWGDLIVGCAGGHQYGRGVRIVADDRPDAAVGELWRVFVNGHVGGHWHTVECVTVGANGADPCLRSG